MREILFRGKSQGDGTWKEGHLVEGPFDDFRIVKEKTYGWIDQADDLVYEDTVGQFTGMLDKNGKRIFEGDIVSTGKERRVVRFRNGAFELLRRASGVTMYDLVGTDVEYEVIGTIHDKEKQNEGK